jgi:hypothetical protein
MKDPVLMFMPTHPRAGAKRFRDPRDGSERTESQHRLSPRLLWRKRGVERQERRVRRTVGAMRAKAPLRAARDLGQAVAVCLYELTRKTVALEPEPRKRARAEDLDRLTSLLNEVLARSGYAHSASTEAKIRRLVRRMDLPDHDAEVWLGMIRQIQWKLGRGGG